MAKSKGTKVVGTEGVDGTVETVVTVIPEVVEQTMEEKLMAIVAKEGLSKSGKMKEMYELGAQVKEIAKLMDVRYNFVYNVISNHCIVSGVALTHTKKESKKDIVWAMFDQGKTVKEVAVDLKTNYQYIYKLSKEWKDQAAKEVAKMEQQEEPKVEAEPELKATGTEGGQE